MKKSEGQAVTILIMATIASRKKRHLPVSAISAFAGGRHRFGPY